MKNHCPLLLLLPLLGGCAVIGNVPQLTDNWYRVVHKGSYQALPPTLHTARVYVQQRADTVVLTTENAAAAPVSFRYRLQTDRPLVLLRRHFDLDIFTIPFKVRPPQAGVPVQLNTNFNAAIYFGQRLDYYSLRTKHSTPFGTTPRILNTGIGYGGFVGVGSTIVTSDLTSRPAVIEGYEALVLHGGLAAIYDTRAFNVGLAVGIDQILGPDAQYWIYHHRPWFGVLFGLDLN